MKKIIEDGKEIMLFDDVEELKWFYHRKYCYGDSYAEYLMIYCVKEDVNKWLKTMGQPYRVKTLIEWMEELEKLPSKNYVERLSALAKLPKWVRKLEETGELPEWMQFENEEY